MTREDGFRLECNVHANIPEVHICTNDQRVGQDESARSPPDSDLKGVPSEVTLSSKELEEQAADCLESKLFSRLESTLEAKMKQIEALLEPMIRQRGSKIDSFPAERSELVAEPPHPTTSHSASEVNVCPAGESRLVAELPHPTTLHPGSGSIL